MRCLAVLLLFSHFCVAQDTLDWNLTHPEWSGKLIPKELLGQCFPDCGGTVSNPPKSRWEDFKYFRIRARIDTQLRASAPDLFARELREMRVPIMAESDSIQLPIRSIRITLRDTLRLKKAVDSVGDSPFEFVAMVRDMPLAGAFAIRCNFRAEMREPKFKLID